MKLYRIDVIVAPSTGHPKYWKVEFGVMAVWVVAESSEDAGQKAKSVIEQLPYEIVSNECRDMTDVPIENTPSEDSSQATRLVEAALQAGKNQASQIGLGLVWIALPTGTDSRPEWPAEAAAASS